MDIEKLIELGSEKLGLSGNALRKWLSEVIEQDENKKKADREYEEAREREREARERERRREEREFEESAKTAERQHEKEMKERELELARLKLETTSGDSPSQTNIVRGGARLPMLQPFDEEKDSIFHFLMRFERFATVSRWEREDWAIHLCALLKGKALEAYTRLSDEQAGQYESVKEALLEVYNLTAEGFREKFRSSRPENGEKMSQFRIRLIGYWERWLELAKKDITDVNEVADVILQEQLMNTCSHQLRVFLKERKPTSSQDLVSIAEMFIEAHGQSAAFTNKPKPKVVDSKPIAATETKRRHDGNSPKQSPCHKCGKLGHWARECRSGSTKVGAVKEKRVSVCAVKSTRTVTQPNARPATREEIVAVKDNETQNSMVASMDDHFLSLLYQRLLVSTSH